MNYKSITSLLQSATETGAGTSQEMRFVGEKVIQAWITGETPAATTILIQVSVDGTHWLTLATIELDGSTTTDGFTFTAPWPYIRSNVTVLGAGCTATVYLASAGVKISSWN